MMGAREPKRSPSPLALACACVLVAGTASWGQDEVNQLVSPDLFGETVDLVTPGYLHWSKASGDRVDPDNDEKDFDNNFGEHAGGVDGPTLSDQARNYGQGNVAAEFVYVVGDKTAHWEFKVPGPGQYVMVTRLWRELQDTTNAQLSYQSGDKWIVLPVVSKIGHWGGFGNLVCFLVEAPEGQKTIPVRIKAQGGRCLIYRSLLGKKREGSPFIEGAKPEHPSLYFKAAGLPALREKVKAGPPKLAWDYVTQQAQWYAKTLNSRDEGWKRGAEHHAPRSIAQTAFVAALTGNQEQAETVWKMMDTVMGWPHDPNPIVDLEGGGFNILERARELSAMAMAYDWLYDRIPERPRMRLRRFLDEEANRLYLYNETFVGCVESGNWDPWIGAGYGMVGIALRDEHRWGKNWVDSEKRIVRFNLARSFEDFGYFNNGFTKAVDFALSLYTATGEDVLKPDVQRLRALSAYRMMLLEPQQEGYPSFGDASAANDPVLALYFTTMLKDPTAQWFIHHLCCPDVKRLGTWAWNHMMPVALAVLYDPTVKEEAFAGLPLARSFANDPNVLPGVQGVTIMRTGYDRTGDVQLAIRCDGYLGWHGHPDQGSFVLNACEDRLVIDRALGAPYGTPANNFSKSALAHSLVFVDDQGQVDYSSPVFYDHEAGYTGPLLHTAFLDHLRADSTVAYRKNPRLGSMDHAHRHFLFVRKPDHHAYVVVLDDVQKDAKPRGYDWLLQTDTAHTLEKKAPDHQVLHGKAELHIFTLEPQRVEVSTKDSFDSWRTLKVSNPKEVERGLFLQVLYPKAKTMPLPEVKRLEGDGVVGARVGSDDENETFLFATGRKPLSGTGIGTDGQLSAAGRKGGKVVWFLCVGGSRLEADGQLLFRADRPVTAAFDLSRNGCVLSNGPATVNLFIGGGHEAVLKATGVTRFQQEKP